MRWCGVGQGSVLEEIPPFGTNFTGSAFVYEYGLHGLFDGWVMDAILG
jgi:hypothetical protein